MLISNRKAFFNSLIFILGITIIGCSKEAPKEEVVEVEEETAPQKEEAEWIALDLSQWRNFKSETISDKWVEEDGVITLTGKGGGDIITKEKFENFELNLEWKISEGGNSGLFFRVAEADTLGAVYHSGPEMQILDNDKHKDGQIKTHRSGDNYDMESSSVETVKPVGEWNEVKLIVKDGNVEQWLNGTKVVEYQFGSDKWNEQYKKSKFTQWPLYGQVANGHLALQDHGDQVWFRNIKIKRL
ncbi:3-keto-disaccharide hydrolase [Flexithrix dorotheae]|uniref:3-keto-disaccharide hydrolase n=1 Tax=Flexithrix dorotheae TaxID=70993 RepID=UPI0003823CFF|nr:DUF1080 domain-containing protein [Flexithrix dorotheae]